VTNFGGRKNPMGLIKNNIGKVHILTPDFEGNFQPLILTLTPFFEIFRPKLFFQTAEKRGAEICEHSSYLN